MRILGLFTLLVCGFASAQNWRCIDIKAPKQLEEGVTYQMQNCTKQPEPAQPDLTVNIVTVDLSSPNVRVRPAVADPKKQLQPVPDMATQNPNFIVGINGGYFWRVDITNFWVDDVCWFKSREEANAPVSKDNVNNGIHDGLIKIDGVVYGNNCNCHGFSRPAVMSFDGENTNVQVLHRGETVGDEVQNAIGAGPNLVSYNSTTKTSYVDIPADDDNINILEYAANTAVAAKLNPDTGKATHVMLMTTDGSDECGPSMPSCGLNMEGLGELLKEAYGANIAISMDQGGSTTMWIKGERPDRNGVVSRSHSSVPDIEDTPRNVANGVFIELIGKKAATD
jgi:exopolysaccharide biosynthesis protein